MASSVSASPTPVPHDQKWFHSEGVDFYEYFESAAEEKAWANGETTAERVETVQIPPEQLKALSTAGLAESVLSYPFQVSLWLYDTPAMAMRAVTHEFNGFQELQRRDDGGQALLEIFVSASIEEVVATDDRPMMSYTTLQYLLADDRIQESLSSGERQTLIKTAVARYREILDSERYSELIPTDATAWLIARTAFREIPEVSDLIAAHPTLKEYLETGQLVADDAEVEAIQRELAALLEKGDYSGLLP